VTWGHVNPLTEAARGSRCESTATGRLRQSSAVPLLRTCIGLPSARPARDRTRAAPRPSLARREPGGRAGLPRRPRQAARSSSSCARPRRLPSAAGPEACLLPPLYTRNRSRELPGSGKRERSRCSRCENGGRNRRHEGRRRPPCYCRARVIAGCRSRAGHTTCRGTVVAQRGVTFLPASSGDLVWFLPRAGK
jgi:hypothetical protein